MKQKARIMEGPYLIVVIASLVVASVSGCETISHYSGCQWYNMQFLNCSSTGISSLPDLFLDHGIKNGTSSLHLLRCLKATKHVDISYNELSALHLNLFSKFLYLETLDMSNNRIYRASLFKNGRQQEKVTPLASLQTLALRGNRLTAIPKGLGKLQSLQVLSLSANKILHIQRDDFVSCTRLQNVDLGGNRISRIHPDAFRDLTSLQVLKLHSNTLVSISPLVFLFSHVLRSDVDLSENPWSCDGGLQPLKHLLSFLSVDVRATWNVTCSTPLTEAGRHLLSTKHPQGFCQPSNDSYVTAKRLIIRAQEEASLHCNISDTSRNKEILWWTPHGIISKRSHESYHYINNNNNLILHQPDNYDGGLYVCLTKFARTVYQVDIQANDRIKKRSPRDLQAKNTQTQTQQNFALAVSLSVILSFLVAFCLGVFLRPYLEHLWRKQCKSKAKETQQSNEMYDNEGYTEEPTTRVHGKEGAMNNSPQSEIRINTVDYEGPEQEAENNRRPGCVVEIQNPTFKAVGEVKEYESVDGLAKTKRVTWASDQPLSTNVNLKYVMSLIKPITFIVPDSMIDTQILHEESSDEGSSFSLGSDYDTSDEDSMTETDFLETKQGTQVHDDTVSPTVNLKDVTTLLKPLRFIVPESPVPDIVKSPTQKQFFQQNIPAYSEREENADSIFHNTEDLSEPEDQQETHASNRLNRQLKDTEIGYDDISSGEGSSYSLDSDYELSEEEEMLKSMVMATKPKIMNENEYPAVDLKHVISLLKPINIIVPELTTIEIVECPTQMRVPPLSIDQYPENSKENVETFPHNPEQKKTISSEWHEPPLHSAPGIHYTDTLNDNRSDGESDFSVDSVDYFSAEDATIDSHVSASQPTWEEVSPVVNLRHVISSLKPISLISIEQSEELLDETHFENHYSDPNIGRNVTQTAYDSSSSEECSDYSAKSEHGNSEEDLINNSVLPNPPQTQWASNEFLYPTVNFRHVISSLKPIQICLPESSHYSDISKSPAKDIEQSAQKQFDNGSPDDSSNESSDDSEQEDSDKEEMKSSFAGNSTVYDDSEYQGKDENTISSNIKSTMSTQSENIYPTVNLRHIVSSLKPIQVRIPDVIYYSDTPSIPVATEKLYDKSSADESSYDSEHEGLDKEESKSLSSESSNDSVDSEYECLDEGVLKKSNIPDSMATEWETHNNLTPTVNLRHVMSTLKPIKIEVPDKIRYLHPPVSQNANTESSQEQLSERSSFDEDPSNFAHVEFEVLQEQVIRSPTLPKPTSGEWINNENVYPTVNLRDIISSLKPIQINLPDSSHYTDYTMIVKSPHLTSQKLYENTSSEEGSNDSTDSEHEYLHGEDVGSSLNELTPTDWMNNEKAYPTVNFRHILSSLKPIHINLPDSEEYSDTLPSLKSTDLTSQTLCESNSSDESSNDSTDSDHEGLDENDVGSNLYETTPTDWSNNDDVYPTVNLKNIVSSLKPIHINLPDSEEYSDTFRSVKSTDLTSQKVYESTSSDESSNDSTDSDHDGLHEDDVGSNLYETPPTDWSNNENVYPTVNLRNIISSLKPIHINIPDSEDYSDTFRNVKNTDLTSQKVCESTSSDESSNHSTDSDHEGLTEEDVGSYLNETTPTDWSNNENVYTTVNLRTILSCLKPIHINLPDSEEYSDTLPSVKSPDLTSQKVSESTLSDESTNDSTDSDNEGLDGEDVGSNLNETTPTGWSDNENVYPTVNLRDILSSLKPIHINHPDSAHFSDTVIPKMNAEATQKLYNSKTDSNKSSNDSEPDSDKEVMERSANVSSNYSDDSEHQELDEEGVKSNLNYTTPAEWGKNENVYITVNLRNVISLLKPIHINVSGPTDYSDTQLTPNKQYETRLSDERLHDSLDSENEHPDEEVTKSSHFLGSKPMELENNKNPIPTVNLKQIISSFKPIIILPPDEVCPTDPALSPNVDLDVSQKLYNSSLSDTDSNDLDDLEHASSDEDIRKICTPPKPTSSELSDIENKYPTVNLRNAVSSWKPIQIRVPDSTQHVDTIGDPNNIYDCTQRLQVNSSLVESSSSSDSEFEDEDVVKKCSLVETTTELTNQTNVYPTVNLRHLISSLKPIHIYAPETTICLSPKMNKHESSNDSSDIQNEILNEEELKNSTLPKSTTTEWGSNENIYPTVSFKHTFSFKPFQIKIPESTYNSDPDNISADDDSNDPEHEVLNKEVMNTSSDESLNDSDSEYEDTIKRSNLPEPIATRLETHEDLCPSLDLRHIISSWKPIKINIPDTTHHLYLPVGHNTNVEAMQKLEDSSSSDEDTSDSDHLERDVLQEEVIRNSSLPQPVSTELETRESMYAIVNLKHVISSIKPIHINIPEYHTSDTGVCQKKTSEDTEKLYDSTSSDESSNDPPYLRHERPNEKLVKTSALPDPGAEDSPTYSDSITNSKTTVVTDNLYNGSSSNINPNDFSESGLEIPYKDMLISCTFPLQIQQDGVSNENVCPTINLRQLISSLKPIQIQIPESTHNLNVPASPKMHLEVTTQQPYNQKSSDESSDADSEREDLISFDLPESIPTKWESNEHLSPTVNFKYALMTLKPIQVTFSDPLPYSDTTVTPNENSDVAQNIHDNTLSDQRSNGSMDLQQECPEDVIISSVPKEILTDWRINGNIHPTVNLRHAISLLKPIHVSVPDSIYYADPLLGFMGNTEVKQKLYHNSSSDETSDDSADSGHEGSYEVVNTKLHKNGSADEDSVYSAELKHRGPNEDVERSPLSPMPAPTEWTNNVNTYPTVNLKYAMSLLKPIKVKSPDSNHTSSALVSPKNIGVTTQKLSYSPSDERPGAFVDSEYNGADECVVIGSSLAIQEPIKAISSNDSTIVNLRKLIYLLKPINVIAPDSPLPGDVNYSKQEPFFTNISSENRTDTSDDHNQHIRHSGYQPKSHKHGRKYKLLPSHIFKKHGKNEDVTLMSYKKIPSSNTSNNLDDWDHRGVDKDETVNDDPLKTQVDNPDINSEGNLKQAMSLIKPISIIVPEYTWREIAEHPTKKQFQPGSPSQNNNNKDNLFRNPEENQLHELAYSNPYTNTKRLKTTSTDKRRSSSSSDETLLGAFSRKTVTPIHTIRTRSYNKRGVSEQHNKESMLSISTPHAAKYNNIPVKEPQKHSSISFGENTLPLPQSAVSREESHSDLTKFDKEDKKTLFDNKPYCSPVTHTNVTEQKCIESTVDILNTNANSRIETSIPSTDNSVHILTMLPESTSSQFVLQWLNSPSAGIDNEEPSPTTSYDHYSLHDGETSGETTLLDLYTQKNMAQPIIDVESLTILHHSTPNTELAENGTYGTESLGGKNIGGTFMDLNINSSESPHTLQDGADRETFNTRNRITSDNSRGDIAKRKTVFEAFTETLKLDHN